MNREYFTQKFNTLYKQNSTKRKDIALKTGVAENKITKLRNAKYGTDPTVDDLIAISNYYDVTIDELLRPQDKKNDQENKTFDSIGDILTALFEIDKCIGIDIFYSEELPFTCTPQHSQPALCFKNSKINEILEEWRKIKLVAEQTDDLKEIVEKPWEEDRIERCKVYTRENDYVRNDMEQAEYLANNLVRYYNAFLADQCSVHYPLTDDQIALIEYHTSLPIISDNERSEIYAALSDLNTSLTYAPKS